MYSRENRRGRNSKPVAIRCVNEEWMWYGRRIGHFESIEDGDDWTEVMDEAGESTLAKEAW